MELYLSACSKTANVAANKAASSTVAEDSQQCGDGKKTPVPGVGAAQLLDLPLGVKLPMIPGTDTVYFTTNISEKLFRPSYGFNLSDPYCRLLETQYKSLHDPHLRTYYKRKDILRRLKKGGYITSNNKIVCSLRELNKYRQYLTSLKLDFERNYLREQQLISKQLHKLQETNQLPHVSDVTRFQNWLLQDNTQSIKDQERLLRHRYLDMISKELEQLERTAEEQRLLRMDREERRQREYTRKKLSLRRKIEEEWKTKEMMLLTKIGEDVKREQRIEEQRRKSREESDRKKQAMLEKKMAYHLQKMQDTGLKDDMGRNGFEYKGQNGTIFESSSKKKKRQFDDIKIVYPDADHKTYKGTSGQVSATVNQSQSSSKNVTKISGSSVAYQAEIQNSSSEQKRNEVMKKISDEKVPGTTSARDSIISAQQSPTKNARLSQTSLVHEKEEKEIQGDWNGRPSKKSSYVVDPGSQGGAPPTGIFSSPVYSNIQQNLQHCLKDKVTSEELNSIIQNIMTWVVATVTSILYPAITKYEERVQSNTYPVSEESDLSSDSSSFCSTCSEGFTYRSYTAKTFQADPCTFASDMPVKKPPTPLKPPSAHVERTVIGQTYQKKGQSVSAQVNYNKASMDYSVPKIGSSKSDSQLLTSLETCTKKSKDATTETESLEIPLEYDKKAKAMDQMKNLKNVFVNFKCHLKGETQLILESIFQEIMSDLSQAIPSLSSVTAEVFVDQTEAEREELLSNVDICSVASEIVENMLEKLESAVEKKCVQIFSQEDVSIDIKPSLSTSGEYFSPVETKPSEDTLNYTLEPMCDIADDMVHTILEKLMILASCKKNEVPPEDTNKHFQQTKTEPIHKVHQQTDQKKTNLASDPANLILKEEIQNLISNIFSQSSLVGYVEEAISTILGYVQTELNNERLIASEETVVLLQLLDDVLTQLHQQPVKVGAKKHKRPRVRNLSDTEEKYRLTGTRSFNSLKSKRPFPPVNVPGMVLYSEDDEEEIDNFVQSVLDSSFSDENAKSQEQLPDYWPKRRDTCFEYKRSNKLPIKSTYQNRVGSRDWGLKLELSLSSEDIVKTKHCLSNEASIFSQDQKHQIQKASENIVKHILTEMLKDISSDSSSYLGSQTDKETYDFISEKSQGLSDQEWMEQIFSGSEICAFAHEITDSVINILHKASTYIPNTIKNAFTSVHHTCIDPSDTAHTSKETSSKKVPCKVWFDSEKKMKYLSSLNVEHEKTSQLKSGKCEPKRVNDITDKIINTIFKRLKLFVCPKLQIGNKSSLVEKSLHSQLSTYTMKIVNIVLHAIQSELEINKINPNLKETDLPKCHKNKGLFTDSNKVVESHVTSVSDDIMESPLLTCICEMITSTSEDKKKTSTCTDKVVSTTICRSGNVHKQNILSNKQDKNSFRQLLAKPCLQHSFADEKDFNDSSKLEVLDQIGETLHEMLRKLTGDHPDSQPSHSHENMEMLNMDPPTLSNTQLISKAILEYVLAKLCDVDIDNSIKNSGLKTVPELLDIDNLSFASTMEEMAKCTNIISNIISKIMKDNNVSKSQAKNDLPVPSKAEIPEVICSPKLKTVASDILSMVFAKLENFASERVENVGNYEDKKDHAIDWECESNSSPADSHDKSFQSTLYSHAKKVSNGILKAIQTELNMNSPNCKTDKKSSPEDTQMLTNIVDLILDVVSEDVFAEPECENQSNENYGYRPTYGNFLPGGAESDSFLDDDTQNKELIRDTTSFSEETRTLSTDQMVLERTLSKIEVKLKEPHRSPIVPIIRNILNEIFQNALISQLNVVSLSRPHFSGMPHSTPASSIQTFAHSMDQMMGPLVSDTDVSVVVNDVVRTVFHKLYSAAMTEKYVSENRCKTIIFSANVSFHEHTYGGNAPVSGLNGNACDLQSSWNVDKQTKINVVEDIVQAILENLETFAASKVESFFCPQTNFTVPVTLPVQQEVGSLSQAISGKDSYSDNQLPYCSVDHSNPEHIDTCCQMSLSKLNIYAKEVARKILQGIKHELDKEQESPLLTNNIMVSENIASQVVNTVLDIVSCKSKSDKNSSDKENYSDQQVGIIERLVNKTEYRKILEFQIQDTIEGILCDIYENIMYQNNLSFATPTPKYGIPAKHSKANFEPVVMGTNIIPKVSVPKADVILVSKDIVDIVLHNLTSLVMLAINAKDSASARLTIYDIFPKSQGQQPLSITQRTEGKPGHFSHSKDNNLAYPDFFQMPVNGKEDTKEPAPEACEQNANCITETIFNRLQSFATERINSLMTLAFQSKGNVSPQFENGKDDKCIFQEPGQAESDVNVLKLSTTKTVPSQELAEPIFARCRENFGTITHLSQTSLKGYAAFIASTILKLIKNDLDLEIQSMQTYSNHVLFQKNMIVCEIVNSILKILHNKESVHEFFLSPSENSSCSQLTMSREVLLGYKEKEKAAALPQFTNDSLEENQITVEKESQRDVLEEIFMRKGESKPREKTEILRTVEEVLTKLSQKIMEIIGHIAPFNEMPYIVSKSKSKTAATTWKKFFQSHINNVSNDILENVLGEMHSVVVTSLYKKNKSRREGEMHDSSDSSSGKPPGFRETKPTRKSSALRLGLPQMHPYADNLNALVLENTFLPYSPLQIGKYLVQIVLDKLSNFVSLHLEEGYPPEGSYDDLYLLRLHNSKLSPKNSPRPGCKTSLKMRSKITSLSKFKTKPHLGISCTKTKNKTKLSPGEKTPRENRSKTALGLPQTSQAEDAKTTLKTKLPVAELKVYATNIITDILEVVMSGLERAAQHRAMFNTKVLASSQILEASKIVSAVLQELYATNKLASPDNISNLSEHRLCKQNLGAGYSTEQPCFYLENVSSQLEQIFPKEGILKKMFDKWQTETSDTETEKSKLLTIAENILTEISIKAKDLEHSLSLLNLPPLEECENRFYDCFKGVPTRAEDTKAQINMFGREIVEMLFEKLQLCFLSQMPTQDGNRILTSRKGHVAAKSKHGVPTKHILSGIQTCNMKTKDQMSMNTSNQIVHEIVERVLNMLESFVDLKFKNISKYEFSEIVKMPIDNLFQVQQRQLSKKMLPKVPFRKGGDESKSSTVMSKENVQDTLLQVHLFHSELLTYSVTTVSGMLRIIKNKLDKEISQMEPSPVSILKENIAASEIIGTLIDQCSHFSESLIKNLPTKNWFKGTENVYIVNQVEFVPPVKMPPSNTTDTVRRSNSPPRSVSGLEFTSDDGMKEKYSIASNSSSHISSYVENTGKTSEPHGRPNSKVLPTCSRQKAQDHGWRKPNSAPFEEVTKAHSFLPEGSVLQKLFKKVNNSTEESLKQVLSFIEMGKGENPRVFHYETTKSAEPNEIKTTASPLKICLAAENIVNTVLSSYGFPHQVNANESMETMKPFFMSGQNSLSEVCEGQKDTEKTLLTTWCSRTTFMQEEESGGLEACQDDFSLLHKWKNKNPQTTTETLEETDTIVFADHELGPNEMHLVARHITASVITHLKNFKTAVSTEMLSHVSSLSKKNDEAKQPLKSIYSNSSVYLFCEQLSEAVICYLISNISDGTKESSKEKEWEICDALFDKNILIHSQLYKTRSISIGDLTLRIFEVIVEVLSNGNMINADKAHQASMKAKYKFRPGVTSSDFDDIFQDLLKGVIVVLSEVLGIDHFENNVRNKSCSTFKNSLPISNKVSSMENQIGPRELESSPHLTDHLAQKNKLNYLARRLNSLVGKLRSRESKEVVNEVFNIVLDLFLPDELPDGDMSSGKLTKTFSSSNNQQSNRTLTNNLGLSPKSIFLLNIVCEKLIRTLLEKCTGGTTFFEDSSHFPEVPEEHQRVQVLPSVQGGGFGYRKAPMDCEQFQGDYMSDLLENLADVDQDLLSSDCILNVISHSLVKSLMDKLSHGFQQAPFENKYRNYRTREIQPFIPKAKQQELIEPEQTKAHAGFMSYDNSFLTKSLNNTNATSFKMHTRFDKQHAGKSISLSFPDRKESREINTVSFHKLCQRGVNGSVFSATFLEEIISELFFNLSTSLWKKNLNITEAWLNEINTLLINSVVKKLNNAQITVLRYPEERLYFPSAHKGCITKIVDSIYYDVLQQYEFTVTCGGNLPYDNTPVAERISNSILLEIIDYQLPSCFKGKLRSNLYHTLNADIILYKLQNSFKKFNSEPMSSKGYSTMLPHSFLEYVIRRLLAQLIPLPIKSSSLEKKYLTSSDFNEMSNCITNKVMAAISKHKIWFTIYDNQCLHTDKNLQKMVDSVYRNILEMSDSLDLIQKNIISRSPIMIDQIASFIIQEIIENHLQPFLCGETLPRPKTPLDEVSYMVKQVLNEVVESHKSQKPSPFGIYPENFVGEVVTRVFSKIFSPKPNTNVELKNMTKKIVSSVYNNLDKAQIPILSDKQSSFPFSNADIVDELVTSVYRNVLKQHGLDPDIDESENGEVFVENITKLITTAISDSLLHPLFSGDLSAASCSNSMIDHTVYDILGDINKSSKPNQTLPLYNTLLPYTFLEDMIRVLLSKFFPSSPKIDSYKPASKDKEGVNFNEIASNLISDIRRKISQHEIRFSKDEEKTKSFYSENDTQNLVDAVFMNILRNSGSPESVEQNITKSNDVFIDQIAGFIIKYICEHHLQPFVERKQLSTSSYKYFDDDRQELLYGSTYSSTFLEDVVSGVVSKIFHRVVGIVQVDSTRNSENVLFDKAENLIYWITEEFSKAQVTTIENAEERLSLSRVEGDILRNIIDTVYSKVLEEYEMEIRPDKDFLNDTKALAGQITKIILTEISYFQIPPDLIANLPLHLHSKLSQNVLVNRVHYDISKSRFRRQASTMYTTMLSHAHLEKIVTQLMSQINPSDSSVEYSDTSQSELSSTVIKLINEIMSIVSKHAICIVKHGNEKQSMISEKDMQSMVDSIYADLSHSNLYQSLTKDKKGLSSIPVSKIASFIIKEIFNHHLESFLSGDKSIPSSSVAQTCKKKATTSTKQRELSFIVNSAVFLEEVITELLCKILQTFIQNSLSTETPEKAIAKIMDIVTTLVKSIVFEFTTSEILVAEHLDESLWFSETYKEMVQKTVNSVYVNLFNECKSLTQLHRAVQNDTSCFGGKIYHFLLEEMYDYQVQSLVSGELMPSCYSSPQAANIIKNVLNVILKDTNALPSCITVLPCSVIENMIYKLLENIFPSDDTENELKKEETGPDDVDEFMAAASKLTDEIIQEISEHEIRFANAEETASLIYETTENFIDSVCNNILKKSEFQEVQKDAHKKGGSFLSKMAGSIIKEIMDHHLQLFLYGEDSPSSNLPHFGGASVVAKSGKEKAPSSLFSAAFLEDVIVDLAQKFCSFLTLTGDARKKDMPEAEIVSLAIKFANSLIRDFRKSGIKILPHAEEIFSFPPIAKETIDEISNFVYDQFIGKFGADGIQKDGTGNIVIEMVSSLAQKAISTFKIQPLFSGDWCSTFFSFLDPENISQRVQLLPKKTSMQIHGSLKQNQLALSKDTSINKDDTQDPILNSIATIMKSNILNLLSGPSAGITDAKKEEESKVKHATQETTSPPTSPPTSMKGRGTQVQPSAISPPTTKKSRGDQVQPSATSPPTTKKSRGDQVQPSATSPPTTKKSRGDQVQPLSDKCKSTETGKENLVLVNEQGQILEIFTHFAVATTVENSPEKEVLRSDLKIQNEKKIDVSKGSVKTDDKPKSKNKETMTEKTILIPEQPVKEEKRQSVAEIDKEEEPYSETECVENVIENIYDNVFIISSQEPLDFSRPKYSKSLISDRALSILQDSAQLVTTKALSSSVHKDIAAKEKASEDTETKRRKESETKRLKEIKSEPSMTDHPKSSLESKPKIVPANFLEDVITELVDKLIFTPPPETEKCDKTTDTNDQKPGELYDTAMRLVNSMMKAFSDAEIKVFRPDKENEVLSQAVKESAHTAPPEFKETTVKKPSSSTNIISEDKMSHVQKTPEQSFSDKLPSIESAHTAPPEFKETTIKKSSSSMDIKNEDKMSHVQKTPEQSFSDKLPSIEKIPSMEKSIVNKIVHSCVCNVLKECKSQESICEDINSNGENLAKRLTSTVISEIFQHQLNLIFSDEVPASACVPLESKDVEKKVQTVMQTASKECQTSSPYTIQLPYRFLEDVTSGLFTKVFSKLSNVKTKLTSENVLTQLDFLQMNLVKTIASEISKNEDLIIQYVESLHPNDDEIIQLVVQTIYNNLLPQFGSQEILQKCIISGCKLLSKTIVDLVLREVTGNQLQNYFGGELTPYQCAEVDNVVENILTNVILTTPSKSSTPRKLSYNIIETIAVKFLSKLLSVFPKGHTERTKSQETEMQKITSKILNSIQEFITKSKIKVVQPAKESEAVPSADKATIDKVVNSVYSNLLKHSGSPTSVFEDLMGKSDVLSDIIGFSMVKEISNSEFQPQAEEELSSSELALEAVKIMEKVVKIIDELKSQEKSASIRDVMLDSRILEEALALFLAKLVRTPGPASKDTNSLTKPELNKIASQLTKSVTAEISKSNISLVESNHEEQSLDPENIEVISQVVDSVYSNIITQSGTQNELYDKKGTKKTFPKKVASLIVDGVSSVRSCRVSTESSYTGAFGDLDTNRIIEKAQKHAALMSSDSEKESEDTLEDEIPVKIIPHVRNKPMKIDPNIVSEHLAVISMKTQPLETLKMDCIKRTGCSIAELRRASISGKGHSSTDVPEIGTKQKERRISLDRTGRLDVKPLEAVGRNSFQNVRRPDITRVELLKDINNKKDLIIRLVAHDIGQKVSDSSLRDDTISDEEEIVLGEVVGDQCLRKIAGSSVQQVVKPTESQVVSPKTATSAGSLKRFLSLSKCCQPTSGENIESIEATENQKMEPSKTYIKRAIAELDMPTSKSLAEATSSRDTLQYKKEEILATEPTHYFIHRIMSTSSYNQEDLLSGEAEDFIPDPKANALEESYQEPQEGNSNSVEFVTIYEGSKHMASSARLSKEHISELPRSSISKQGSKVLAKVSSTLSKVFSRSSGSIPKSSSPPHQDKF